MVPDRTELGWSYQPADFFEGPYERTDRDALLRIDVGRAVVTVSGGEPPPDVEQRLLAWVRHTLQIRSLQTGRTFELNPQPNVVEFRGSNRNVILRAGVGSFAITGGNLDVVQTNASGKTLVDTKAERLKLQTDELDDLAAKAQADPVLGTMLESFSTALTDVAYSAPGATTSTTIYDEHERPSEVSFYDANNALVSRVEFSRDQDGRVLSERMEFAGPGGLLGPAFDANMPADERASMMELLKTVFDDQAFSVATYAYDEKGRRIETIRRMGKLSEERVTVRYDDFDNPVEEVRSDVSREMRMDDGVVKTEEKPSHVQHVRFEFRYDAHGNWTERIVWQRMEPNADERPSNIERRAINFYGQ